MLQHSTKRTRYAATRQEGAPADGGSPPWPGGGRFPPEAIPLEHPEPRDRTSTVFEAYQNRTLARLLARADQGSVLPWRAGWAGGFPRSGGSGHPYRGINPWLLAFHAHNEGYGSGRWYTAGLVARRYPGAHLREGSLEARVVYLGSAEEGPGTRSFSVYNRDCFDGLPPEEAGVVPPGAGPWRVRAILEVLRPEVRAGPREGPHRSAVHLPPSGAGAQGTGWWWLLEELVRWTGEASRLGRPDPLGAAAEDRETLVAELGGWMLAGLLDLDAPPVEGPGAWGRLGGAGRAPLLAGAVEEARRAVTWLLEVGPPDLLQRSYPADPPPWPEPSGPGGPAISIRAIGGARTPAGRAASGPVAYPPSRATEQLARWLSAPEGDACPCAWLTGGPGLQRPLVHALQGGLQARRIRRLLPADLRGALDQLQRGRVQVAICRTGWVAPGRPRPLAAACAEAAGLPVPDLDRLAPAEAWVQLDQALLVGPRSNQALLPLARCLPPRLFVVDLELPPSSGLPDPPLRGAAAPPDPMDLLMEDLRQGLCGGGVRPGTRFLVVSRHRLRGASEEAARKVLRIALPPARPPDLDPVLARPPDMETELRAAFLARKNLLTRLARCPVLDPQPPLEASTFARCWPFLPAVLVAARLVLEWRSMEGLPAPRVRVLVRHALKTLPALGPDDLVPLDRLLEPLGVLRHGLLADRPEVLPERARALCEILEQALGAPCGPRDMVPLLAHRTDASPTVLEVALGRALRLA